MNAPERPDWMKGLTDKTELQRVIADENARMGFVRDPDATPQKARSMMKALGIRAEDNLFSCGIIAAREEE